MLEIEDKTLPYEPTRASETISALLFVDRRDNKGAFKKELMRMVREGVDDVTLAIHILDHHPIKRLRDTKERRFLREHIVRITEMLRAAIEKELNPHGRVTLADDEDTAKIAIMAS